MFKQYDPGQIVVIFKGVQILGYASGTFVKASRTKETFAMSVGAGGDVVRVRSRDKTGSVAITIQAASPTNDVLTGFIASDEATGSGVGALLIKDLYGTTLITADKAWLEKPADGEYAADSPDREWTICCAELFISNGGSTV